MRISRVQTYPVSTQLTTYAFFCLFVLTVPMYYFVYYFGLLEYVLNSVPVYLKDSVYCVSYCKRICFGIITVGNILSMGIGVFLGSFPTRYISKTIAYLIGVFTLPVSGVVVYFAIWYLAKLSFTKLVTLSYGVCIIVILGVGLSLVPPFCRRRAHVLAGLLSPHVETFKLMIRLALEQKPWICSLPWILSTAYLVGLSYYRSQKASIELSASEEYAHKSLCILGGFIIRFAVVLWCIFRVFKLPRSSSQPISLQAFLYLGFLSVVNAGYILLQITGVGNRYCKRLTQTVLVFVRIYLEWSLPIHLLNCTVARTYIKRVHFGKEWLRANLAPILCFDLCRFYIIFPAVILPLTVTYYIFDKLHERTTSEISIVISFTRMTFTYIYVFIDSLLRILFLGQKLGIPLKLAKRVTYTDIANTYSTIAQAAVERNRARREITPV